jgi:hypothetical protein
MSDGIFRIFILPDWNEKAWSVMASDFCPLLFFIPLKPILYNN